MGRRVGALAAVVALVATAVVAASTTAHAGVVGGTISGRVRVDNGVTIEPCEAPSVTVFVNWPSADVRLFNGTSDGNYVTDPLPAGDHMVVFGCSGPGDWRMETFNNLPGFDFSNFDAVHVTDGNNTSQIDAVLAAGGAIEGKVTKGNGDPLPDCRAFPWAVYENGVVATSGACPDATGEYHIAGAPKRNLVQFNANAPLFPEWWNNHFDMANANLVKVPVGTTTTGINAKIGQHQPPASPSDIDGPSGAVRLPNGMIVPIG